MKKVILIGCLFLLLLCAAPAALATDSAATFSVTVPSVLPVAVSSDGSVTVATDARIVNNSVGTVKLDAVSIVPQNSWRLDAWGTDYSTTQVDSRNFAMRFGGVSVPASGVVDVSACAAIAGGGSMGVSYDARIAAQTANLNTTIANVVFTVSWENHGPVTSLAVNAMPTKTEYNAGEAFDPSGMAITATFADGTQSAVTGWTVSDGGALAADQTSVTVSFTADDNTVTVAVPVTVISETVAYACLDGSTLVFDRAAVSAIPSSAWTGIETTAYAADADVPWLSGAASIQTVEFRDAVQPVSTYGWFKNCSSLTGITGLENLDTSLVTNMQAMFSGCSALTGLDVSGWDTSNVTSTQSMFYNCRGLTSLDVSAWVSPALTNAGSMFYSCSGLSDLRVAGWSAPLLENCNYMFGSCSALTALDLTGLVTGETKILSGMFADCASLRTLTTAGWDTSGVTNFGYMFMNCMNLVNLDTGGWTSTSATNMDAMFLFCSSLTTLDLSNFDTRNLTSMLMTFSNCPNLRTIYASNAFTVSGITYTTSDPFSGCYALVGSEGTTWIQSTNAYLYAHIDAVGNPGYFSAKGASGHVAQANQNPSTASVRSIIKFGSIYMDGTPLNTTHDGGLGYVPMYRSGTSLAFDSALGVNSAIGWVKVSSNLLIADRNLITNIPRDRLDELGLISGQTVTINGVRYRLRMISNAEWNSYIVNGPLGTSNTYWHWADVYSYTSDFDSATGFVVARGYDSAAGNMVMPRDSGNMFYGFRPVLEIL